MSDNAARPTLLQRVVLWVLAAAMFYVVALHPVYLMARFEPDDVVHYGFLRWMAVVLILYWTAQQLFFTQAPSETRAGRMLLAFTASIMVIVGTFSPIVSFSFIGDIDYFRDGYSDGYILLIMAGLSLALAVTGRWKQVLLPALGSLAVILWTFLGVQDTTSQARAGMATELTGNPHEGLAASVMQSIQWEWGWVLLFAGSGLLVYSAARRHQPEAASPPLMSVPIEPETESALDEAAPEAAAETVPAETAGAAERSVPTAEAPAEKAEAAAEAPAEKAETAAEAPAGIAETAAEAPPEEAPEPATASEPATPESVKEPEAAAVESAAAKESEAAAADSAVEAAASVQEPEAESTEAAEEPAPEPEAEAVETAPPPPAEKPEAAATEPAAEESDAATTEPAAARPEASAAEAVTEAWPAPAPESPPAEAAADESASAPDEPGSAAAEPATGTSTEQAASASEPTTDAAKK